MIFPLFFSEGALPDDMDVSPTERPNIFKKIYDDEVNETYPKKYGGGGLCSLNMRFFNTKLKYAIIYAIILRRIKLIRSFSRGMTFWTSRWQEKDIQGFLVVAERKKQEGQS